VNVAKAPERWLSALSVANACYVLGRSQRPGIDAPLSYMRSKFRLAALTEDLVHAAARLDLADFEDALQWECATSAGVDLLVTRNGPDFKGAGAGPRILSPEEALEVIEAGKRR
jgi:hypothetical protein